MIYKTLTANYILRNLKTEQHEPHLKPLVNSGAPEVVAVPTPLMTPVVLLVKFLHLKKCKEMWTKRTIIVGYIDPSRLKAVEEMFNKDFPLSLHRNYLLNVCIFSHSHKDTVPLLEISFTTWHGISSISFFCSNIHLKSRNHGSNTCVGFYYNK